MIGYDDALQKVLERIRVLGVEEKPLLKCAGQILWENVYADANLPQSNVSGPDGYAVRSKDIKNASPHSPALLDILGTARAGHPLKLKVKRGTCIRIMTGSVVPDGADCVVRFEDTDEPADKNGPNRNNPSRVSIYVPAAPGDNIRPAGSSVAKGTCVASPGMVVGPTQISALAAIGKKSVKVVRRPVVAIIVTGDELISPGARLARGKTYNANAVAVASLVAHYGGIPRVLGIARDTENALIAKIRKGITADAIITTGGVSKGDYDLVRLVLGRIGKIVFSRINMGPGAAVAFGAIKRASDISPGAALPVFSLAGPPAGCLVNFETLVRPALLKMRGFANVDHPWIEATAVDAVPRTMPMSFVKYADLQKTGGEYRVTLNLGETMGMLASIAGANALAVIPAKATVKAGDRVRVLPLDWCR